MKRADRPTTDRSRLHVLLTVPDGEQARILLSHGLLEMLCERSGHVWHVLSPLAPHEVFARAIAEAGAQTHPWPAERARLVDRQLYWLRQELARIRVRGETTAIFLKRMRRWQPRRFWTYHLLARGLARCPGSTAALAWVHRCLPEVRRLRRFLDQVGVDLVILGSGGAKPVDEAIASAALSSGRRCFGIVPSWDNLTTKGPIPGGLDRLAVWCRTMEDEAERLHGYRREQIVITGPPAFDAHRPPPRPEGRDRFLTRMGLDPKRRLITYTSVPTWNAPFSAAYARLLHQFVQSGALGNTQLLVRLHPMDSPEAFAELESAGVRIDRPGRSLGDDRGYAAIFHYWPTSADLRRLTETIAYSDVLVNVASTITLEACALDRPVINLGFTPRGVASGFDVLDYYRLDHYAPVARSAAVPIVRSEEDLLEAIREALEHPQRRSAARRQLYRRYDPFEDGQATGRLADAILQFIAENQKQGSLGHRRVA